MRLRRQNKITLSSVYLVSYLSGVLLFIASHWLRTNTPIGPQHIPQERWLRFAHVSVTYALVLGLGSLVFTHIVPGFKRRKHLSSGTALTVYWLALIVSAIFTLYSVNDSEQLNLAAWIHSLVGITTPALLLIHLKAK